jgi:myo-inositol-1(or 4)-monophosphatase
VVYEPERDALYTSIEGRGARLNDRLIHVDQFADGVEAFQRAVVGVDWPGDMNARKEMLTIVGTLVPVVLSVRAIGSPALGLCYVAAGRLHGYSGLDLRPWDVAPAGVILQNAGGVLTNFAGSSWYHSPDGGYVASNSIIHGRLLQSSQAVLALRRLAEQRTAAAQRAVE